MAWNCLKFTEATLWHNMMVDFDRFSLTLSKKKQKKGLFSDYYLKIPMPVDLTPESSPTMSNLWQLFPQVRGFWKNVWQLNPCLRFFFFFWAQINLRTLIPLFRPGQDQSSVAQHTETTVTHCSLTTCMWAGFLIGSHTMPAQRHSQPTTTSLGQRCMHV